jgi:hypothetical protein
LFVPLSLCGNFPVYPGSGLTWLSSKGTYD